MPARFTTWLALIGLTLPASGIVQAWHLASATANESSSATEACCHGAAHDETPPPVRHDPDRCPLCHLIAIVKAAVITTAPAEGAVDVLITPDGAPPADRLEPCDVPTSRVPRAPPAA